LTASRRLEQNLPEKLISPRITVMKAKIASTDAHKLKRRKYESELRKLQIRLCHLQDWVVSRGLRVIIIFEGRDAAGKGGTIRAITERVSSRVFRVAALPAPSEREKTQLFAQRYVQRFPAAGEIVIFDRSWYSQAGVDRVMNFASKKNYELFLSRCSLYEQAILDEGIILIKIWLEVSKEEQERRFLARINDPLRQWKLSPMDLESYKYWDDISKVLDMILKATDSKHAPWYILRSDDKRRARLNCISHILSLIPHETIRRKKAKLPKRTEKNKHFQPSFRGRHFVSERY
jgi:polyphosphate kinase 2